MGDNSRNFRSSYYDKVGFRGVEEKKSLEKLINEKPMDKDKLSKFCLRFTLPSIYREYVWQVLLGVVPANVGSHASVSRHRVEQYAELRGAGQLVWGGADLPALHALLFMATEDAPHFHTNKQLSGACAQHLVVLASLFLGLGSTEADAYFMFRNFVLQRRKRGMQLQREMLECILRKEDEALFQHLCALQCWDALPLDQWDERVFAETLHESSLARILDKVIGGSCKVVACVVASLLVVRRHALMQLHSPAAALNTLMQKNPEDVSELAVNKALELYYAASH